MEGSFDRIKSREKLFESALEKFNSLVSVNKGRPEIDLEDSFVKSSVNSLALKSEISLKGELSNYYREEFIGPALREIKNTFFYCEPDTKELLLKEELFFLESGLTNIRVLIRAIDFKLNVISFPLSFEEVPELERLIKFDGDWNGLQEVFCYSRLSLTRNYIDLKEDLFRDSMVKWLMAIADNNKFEENRLEKGLIEIVRAKKVSNK